MNDWFFQILNNISLTAVGGIVIIALFFVNIFKMKRQNLYLQHEISRLQNEFRAMNSGHLGMGRKINQVVAEIANAESQHVESKPAETSAKTYQQASLLLTRGASIEEVVHSCEISPAEAELLAVMCHAAPSHKTQRRSKAFA